MPSESSVQSSKTDPLVLVVDDDPTIVATICGLLSIAGFRTTSAGDVAGALLAFNDQLPDLVLLDVHLPDGSGFDLCRRMTSEKACPSTPVLFISATNDTSTKVEGFDSGGMDYITKPIVGPEVIARVRTHIRLRRAIEQIAELQADRLNNLAAAQRKMMPQPDVAHQSRFHVCIRQVLQAGGDFYDVIPTAPDVVDYLVADASGHDLAASLWTASLKAVAMEFATLPGDPNAVVQAINTSLCRFLPSGAFFTMIYARLDHATGNLSLVSAGHPPAMIVHREQNEAEVIGLDGDVLGAYSDAVFGRVELRLKPGDRLFLYTDGLIDCRSSYREGLQRLADACSLRKDFPLSQLVTAVVDDVAASISCPDDVLLLGIEL